eukprot:COSAG06_NODE_2937_length_6062_cov_2.246017_9_plen_116_part_00
MKRSGREAIARPAGPPPGGVKKTFRNRNAAQLAVGAVALTEEEEALFSQCIDMYDAMKGKGNKPRSSLADERAQEALLTRKAEGVVGDVMCRFEGAPRLGFATAGQRLMSILDLV